MLNIKAQAAKQKIINIADVARLVKKVGEAEEKKKTASAKKLNTRLQTRQQTMTFYDEYSNKIHVNHKLKISEF